MSLTTTIILYYAIAGPVLLMILFGIRKMATDRGED